MKKTIIALLIGTLCISMFTACGQNDSSSTKEPPSSKEEKQVESEGNPETQTSGNSSKAKSNSVVETYKKFLDLLSSNDGFVIKPSNTALDFIQEHESYFPTSDLNALSTYTTYDYDIRAIKKNPDKYGDQLLQLAVKITDITEFNDSDGSYLTEGLCHTSSSTDDEYYYFLYNGSVDVFENDDAVIIGLPIGEGSYKSNLGPNNECIFLAACYLDSADNYINSSSSGFGNASLNNSLENTAPNSNQTYKTLYVVNCNESITLRTSPSTSSKEIMQIPLGSAVSYIETAANGFYKVIYNGNTGYALASYLGEEYTGGAKNPAPAASTTTGFYNGQPLWVVKCKESISLRTQPSTSASAITQIPLNAQVTYLSDASNGFVQVRYNGSSGYALVQYLDEFEPQIAIYQNMTVINCNQSITLRTSPSTSAAEICQIPLGASVYVIEEASNGFYRVEYGGRSGYALSKYLGY